jgi:hypothetical protein
MSAWKCDKAACHGRDRNASISARKSRPVVLENKLDDGVAQYSAIPVSN